VNLPTTKTIRAASEADLEAIRAIYNESIPKRIATADLEPQTLDARRAWFVNRNHATRPVLVAEDAQGVCAWGSYTNFKDRAAYAPTAEISVYVADRAAGRSLQSQSSVQARTP
jgi:phosphinothricin acetyltransferase